MEPKDSFARQSARRAHHAASELRKDMEALWAAVTSVEQKTAGVRKLGRCGLCGEPTKARYCAQCAGYFEDE